MNLLGLLVLILSHSGLCLLAIKIRLPVLKTHRLLGMSIVDALYDYLKAHILALFPSVFVIVIIYRLTWLSQDSAHLLGLALIGIYVLSVSTCYIMLRRSL